MTGPLPRSGGLAPRSTSRTNNPGYLFTHAKADSQVFLAELAENGFFNSGNLVG